MKNIGLYVHIPFCASKCPYCDFYSFRGQAFEKEEYVNAVLREIDKISCKADTLYIGGGTPSVLGADLLERIVTKAKKKILTDNAEITVECNPYGLDDDFFNKLSACGVNRISLGLQSANDNERKKLGRRADTKTIESVIDNIRKAGIENISVDVMLGVPESTPESLERTLQFCVSLDIPHISCYILKIEENTHFYNLQNSLNLPDDDMVADMYLFMCDYLEKHGLFQYEISNFAKSGFESRHNLKYWNDEEYLGIGAAAHSFFEGRRFYYERNARGFIDGKEPVQDGDGGDFEEFCMLRLRLTKGLESDTVKEKFGYEIPNEMVARAQKFVADGYVVCDDIGIRLTRKGFLISNYIISELI